MKELIDIAPGRQQLYIISDPEAPGGQRVLTSTCLQVGYKAVGSEILDIDLGAGPQPPQRREIDTEGAF